MHSRVLTLLVIATLALGACRPAGSGTDNGGRLGVVATFSVIGDMVRRVGADHIELTTLVGPGQDTHTYSPSPSDAARLAQAELVFENGLEFETWLDSLYTASGSTAQRVAVSVGIVPIEAGGDAHDEDEDDHADEHADEHEDEHKDEHAHGAEDPHTWHSVANAMVMVENIRDALASADPANADDYRANAEAYLAELQTLDAWVLEQVQSVPEQRRVLVTTHDTFAYFAERYGFEVLGTVMPTTTEGASPSARELAALVQAMREAGVPAVFAETVSSNALLNQAASEAGVTVIATLFTDALGPAGSGADSYVTMMRHNVTTIVEALRG